MKYCTCHNTDKTKKKNYAKCEKLDTKDHILYDSVDIKCQKKPIYRSSWYSDLPGAGNGNKD